MQLLNLPNQQSSRSKLISLGHDNKLTGVCEQRNKRRKGEQQKTHRKITHNYTTYALSDE